MSGYCIPHPDSGSALGASPVLQAPQESSPGQHREVPEAHPATASRFKAPQLRRNGCGGPGGIGRPTIATPSGTHHRFPGSDDASSPGTLRKAEGTLATAPIPIPDPRLSSTASASALELLNSQAGPEDDHSAAVGDATVTALQVTPSPRKPTFLQRERWPAEGEMEGGAAGQAQGYVHSTDGEGVGNSQRHGEKIH